MAGGILNEGKLATWLKFLACFDRVMRLRLKGRQMENINIWQWLIQQTAAQVQYVLTKNVEIENNSNGN